jgi:hypothetical protein
MLIEGMMGGIELAKYEGIDFTPPEGAREAAKRALEVRETKPPSQRGMTAVGIARARDLHQWREALARYSQKDAELPNSPRGR